MTTLKLDLSWLKNRLQRENHELSPKVHAIISLVDATVESVQRISSRLRPAVLDHLGLGDAIEWLINDLQRRKRLRCNSRISPELEKVSLEPERSIAIFRIFHEAITNILRHADATTIDVDLNIIDKSLVLSVKDNGKGISEDKILDPLSFGIIGMRERASFY